MGYPVSRSFTLEGFEVQFFQRVDPSDAGRPGRTPERPGPEHHADDPREPVGLSGAGPEPRGAGAPGRQRRTTRARSSSSCGGSRRTPGTASRSASSTCSTPPCRSQIAFPGTTPNPDLVTLLNLEIWGVARPPIPPPILATAASSTSGSSAASCTSAPRCPSPRASWLASISRPSSTYRALPPDLAEDMQSSRFRAQYSPGSPGWLARPAELPNTDLNGAFEPGSGPVSAAAAAGDTPRRALQRPRRRRTAPTVTIQVDDDADRPAARPSGSRSSLEHASPIDLDPVGERLTATTSRRGLQPRHRSSAGSPQDFACDGRTECAQVWTVAPTTPGGTRCGPVRATRSGSAPHGLGSTSVSARPTHRRSRRPRCRPPPLPRFRLRLRSRQRPQPTVTPTPYQHSHGHEHADRHTTVSQRRRSLMTATVMATPSR